MIKVYCDGASFDGRGGSGVVFYKENKRIASLAIPLECATCNVAEMEAVLWAVDFSLDNNWLDLDVVTDSMLTVNLINKKWNCHKPHLKVILLKIWDSMSLLDGFKISHIYREFNGEADEMSKIALKQMLAYSRRDYFEALEDRRDTYRKNRFEKFIKNRGIENNYTLHSSDKILN